MPLKLVPPRPGRSPNFYIRGTYLGVYVEQSTGSPSKKVAKGKLEETIAGVERGEITQDKGSFAYAALTYINGGGEKKYLAPIVEEWKYKRLTQIDQAEVNALAKKLYPPGISERPSEHNATINRQVHTPVSAVLKAGGYGIMLKRPPMLKGKVHWITPAEAERWLKGCSRKLRRLSIFLLYTGCRIGEALGLQGDHIDYAGNLAYLGRTKNEEGRGVHLPPVVMAEIREVIAGRGVRIFGYNDRWEVYDDWNPLRKKLGFPDWWTPHVCCHTWATWMRQYAGMDIRGLLGTDRWKDLKSVLRYQHVVASDESKRVEDLPGAQNPWNEKTNSRKSVA